MPRRGDACLEHRQGPRSLHEFRERRQSNKHALARPDHIDISPGIQISPPGEGRIRLRLMTIKAATVPDHLLARPVHQLGVTMTLPASSPVIAPGQKAETFRYWRMCAWAGPVFLFVF